MAMDSWKSEEVLSVYYLYLVNASRQGGRHETDPHVESLTENTGSRILSIDFDFSVCFSSDARTSWFLKNFFICLKPKFKVWTVECRRLFLEV